MKPQPTENEKIPRLLKRGKCYKGGHEILSMDDLHDKAGKFICAACFQDRQTRYGRGLLRKYPPQVQGFCKKGVHDITLPGATLSVGSGRSACKECKREATRRRTRKFKEQNPKIAALGGTSAAYKAEVTLDCPMKHTILFSVPPMSKEVLWDYRCQDYFPILSGRSVYLDPAYYSSPSPSLEPTSEADSGDPDEDC